MKIAIVGGNGSVGAEAARELERRGHAVRVLSRRAPEFPVDLGDGSGLAAALAGVDVVVDAANGDRKVLVDGTARLLRAAAAAGVRHHVGVSIVGVDRVGGRYYRAKLAQEEQIRRSGVPWTIVRATQFHTLVARTFAASSRLGILPSAGIPMQPVDPREVGRVLAETAEAEPSLAITQFAGPEVLSVRELAHRWRRRTGSHAVPVRLQRVEAAEIRNLEAWLTTTVSRLALDTLRSARVRREAYVGPWLPEPVVKMGSPPTPAERAEMTEDLSLALLVVLESLSASERVAFVLHDVFGYEFREIADVLGATPQAARQQASRARRAVEARRPRFPATHDQQREAVEAFSRAALDGDVEALLAILHPDVVFTADGGGVVTASRKPLVGADRVARAITALVRKGGAEADFGIVDVNGLPGLLGVGGGLATVVSFTVDGGRIVALDVVRNPEKLRLP